MQQVLIIGGGQGGSAILRLLASNEFFHIVGLVEINQNAPAIEIAKDLSIPISNTWNDLMKKPIDIIFDVTGKKDVFEQLLIERKRETVLIPGTVANMLVKLLEEKDQIMHQVKEESSIRQLIFDSIDEGMVGVDQKGIINFFNKSAQKMTEIEEKAAIGKHINEVIPSSELPRIYESGRSEYNREMLLHNGLKIVTSRFPIIDERGNRLGSFAVFKDITEVVNLAEEITNLKEIQTMLQAIIQSSDDAISVVDENGKGLLINPAYTRITGLETSDVIGKPATADISEGESIHLKVLQKKQPIRGVNLLVGPSKREVIVNVAPILVNNRLKGSVGVIHDMTEIRHLMKELDRARSIIRTLESKYTFDDIVGKTNEMELSIEQAKLAAKTPVTVLLRGESGTGKELFAHAIHSASDRKYNKFIRVNCSASEPLQLEKDLFGEEIIVSNSQEIQVRRGLLEEANLGSIFLDEIGELSASTQAKLLRVLQESELTRIGGKETIHVDVRVIAATNIHMEKAMSQGIFREDLYYRLNRMPIQIPPLRSRIQDIPLLADKLLIKLNQEYGRNVEQISNRAMKKLQEYEWPGNVRELENMISRGMIFMNPAENTLDVQHFPFSMFQETNLLSNSPHQTIPLTEQLEKVEKEILQHALSLAKGNKSQAARELDVSLRTLYYKLDKYGLT
ncbi:sigma 54-interacting transcriptional regulator [Paenisporosarcina cavernae]|uniref:PAS domain-containing protein n=1 Tax=Paenisporosarcina cavernae TaxID=2320858 RepID=A0A385YT85_9BACL|nr:sigma 54-interacting transcriptional regulator [Paenisporosarcina cavernae]AYC29530.1 PAS domain-containing protein [Paenisporosarcina cavernae]